MMISLLWSAAAAIVLLAGWRYRSRIRELRGARGSTVGDDDIRRIIEEGRLAREEEPPLDPKAAAEAEEAFWEEYWDEPEEYRDER